MTPLELYRLERAKRPHLVFAAVPTLAERPTPKIPPSKQHRQRGVYAHPEMSTHERAVHGQLTKAGKRAARGEAIAAGMRAATARRASR